MITKKKNLESTLVKLVFQSCSNHHRVCKVAFEHAKRPAEKRVLFKILEYCDILS